MARLLWGQVYYKDQYAGVLREEPGDRFCFAYDSSYLKAGHPAIAHTLPLTEAPAISLSGLPSFFDNLVAEGWLEHAQSSLLGKRQVSRFELLLAFGYDCAGAVSVVDPDPVRLSELLLDAADQKEMALLTSRASLSGVQPKLAVVEKNGKYHPATVGELSTHIAKFPSSGHPDLIINEYLTMHAFHALLPQDEVADVLMGEVVGVAEPALVIKRFDRSAEGRIHFEEFNSLLGRASKAKYSGAYKEMSDFIRMTKGCVLAENHRLFERILVGILLGNTDMHLKNFAMFNTPAGFHLTPSYDQVDAALYKYKTMALALGGASDLVITTLKPNNIMALAREFSLSFETLALIVQKLEKNKAAALDAILSAKVGSDELKNKLKEFVEARWKGTFGLIGPRLLKKL